MITVRTVGYVMHSTLYPNWHMALLPGILKAALFFFSNNTVIRPKTNIVIPFIVFQSVAENLPEVPTEPLPEVPTKEPGMRTKSITVNI